MRISQSREVGYWPAAYANTMDGFRGCVPDCPCCQPAMAPSLGLFGISRVSNFEALVLQVWIKSMAGKKPGHKHLLY